VPGTQVKAAWIRRDVKRLPGKTKMALIGWNHEVMTTDYGQPTTNDGTPFQRL